MFCLRKYMHLIYLTCHIANDSDSQDILTRGMLDNSSYCLVEGAGWKVQITSEGIFTLNSMTMFKKFKIGTHKAREIMYRSRMNVSVQELNDACLLSL
jgi:hypothetical protein